MSVIKYKPDGFLITVNSGIAGGNTQEQEVELDASYEECVGVEIHEVSSGGVANGYYQVGVSDKDDAYVPLVHKNALLTSAAVPQDQKRRSVNIPIASGRKLKVRTLWPIGSSTTSALQYEIIFTLIKSVTPTR
jgi:hypothetical protein